METTTAPAGRAQYASCLVFTTENRYAGRPVPVSVARKALQQVPGATYTRNSDGTGVVRVSDRQWYELQPATVVDERAARIARILGR